MTRDKQTRRLLHTALTITVCEPNKSVTLHFTYLYIRQHLLNTRKLCYHKDDRVMRPQK